MKKSIDILNRLKRSCTRMRDHAQNEREIASGEKAQAIEAYWKGIELAYDQILRDIESEIKMLEKEEEEYAELS